MSNRISVAPFIPYYTTQIGSMKFGIRPYPLEKSPKNNKRRGIFIPDSRVTKGVWPKRMGFITMRNEIQQIKKGPAAKKSSNWLQCTSA